MKIPIGASILVLAVVAGLGWKDHIRLNELRDRHEKLAALAVAHDIPDAPIRITKYLRENPVAVATRAAAEFIRAGKERAAIKRGEGKPDVHPPEELAPSTPLDSLDAAQIRAVVARILEDPEIDDSLRKELVSTAIQCLVSDDPQGALTLFNEQSELIKDTALGRNLVSTALCGLAKENPSAALEWTRNNTEKFPFLVAAVGDRMVINAALKDPELAFEMIRSLQAGEEHWNTESAIMRNANTAELRTAALAAFRKYVSTLSEQDRRDLTSRAYQGLAANIAGAGFESGSKWIASANLTPGELSDISGVLGLGLLNSGKIAESGQWIAWATGNLPLKDRDRVVGGMVSWWTRNDFQAAGAWLAKSAEGPGKNVAIRAFAETVSRYEPETAAQWALTLPPGNDRDETLKNIHRNWPQTDSAGMEAFARKHGIEK